MTGSNADRAALARYRAAWRWHFYAGLVVIPFLLVLALSGLIMLYYSTLQTPHGERLTVPVASAPLAADRLLDIATAAQPGAQVTQYAPPGAANDTARFTFDTPQGALLLELDPYSGALLRRVHSETTVYAWALRLHGTLLLGDAGNVLVEIVAGLTLLMLATGLYMWLLRRAPRAAATGRARWREWHQWTGVGASLVLCFFLFSGLAWSSIWGSRLVQAWNTFPAERWGPVALSGEHHETMNHGGAKEVPWGLEQTPLPAAGKGDGALTLVQVTQRATALGFGPRYRINLPRDASGVYTLTANSMTGDIERFADERTVHLDPPSGEVLAQAGFEDYSLAAKAMAVGVGLHQAGYGRWNALANALACLALIFLCLSGALLCWWRRPSRARLASPPRAQLPAFADLHWLLLTLGVIVPLLGLTLLAAMLLNRAARLRPGARA